MPFADGDGARRDASRFHPWPRGRTAERHDGAFWFWRELIASGELRTPFDVVHVDAHADLGLGDANFEYLMCDLLHRPVKQRAQLDADRVLEGNYLAFAAACRWFRTITYVRHPARRGDDRPIEYFRDNDPDSGWLELKRCDPTSFAADLKRGRIASSVIAIEPAVKFETRAANDFQADREFDFVVLARSPAYTPKSADALIPVIEEYFDPC